ncbi:MAG: serine--tRNA ligase, partial [Pseudomonadota bacterium]
MLDPKRLRTELEETAAQLARRGFKLDVDTIRSVEERRKSLQIETQNLQNERNSRSKTIGQAKAKGEDIAPLLAEVANMGDTLKAKEQELARLQSELDAIVMGIPNLLDASVPDGKDENANVEIRRWGEPTAMDFIP